MLVQLAGPILLGTLVILQAPQAAPSRDVLPQAAPGTVAPLPARNSGVQMRCGMKVVIADPSIDPKINARRDGVKVVNPDPKMVIPLPPCAEDKR